MAKGIDTASPSSKLDEVMARHFGKKSTKDDDDGCQVGGGGGAYSIRMIPFYLSKSHDTIIVAIRHQRPGDLDVWNFKPEYVVKALTIYKDEFMTKTKDVSPSSFSQIILTCFFSVVNMCLLVCLFL